MGRGVPKKKRRDSFQRMNLSFLYFTGLFVPSSFLVFARRRGGRTLVRFPFYAALAQNEYIKQGMPINEDACLGEDS